MCRATDLPLPQRSCPSRWRQSVWGISVSGIFLASAAALPAEDWPTFRHDNYRSAQTDESLDAEKLALDWVWQSPQPPQPAWAGPAKWDAYNDIPRLNSMRNYDAALHVVVSGDAVYFGSSADDTVRCLDARSGKERWRFTAAGPVRIAPTVSAGKVYFGSDDGAAYCLDAETGSLVWKFNPRDDYRKVINNNRLISFWPVRTGITVEEGTAYFCASMLPWKRSYLCAVDAETGRIEGEGRFVKEVSDSNSFEGAMLASADRLIIPQGRIAPLLLSRHDGSQQGKVDYHGSGCFALLTPDNQLYHGPGNRDGNFTASNVQTGARLATFPMGQALIVSGRQAYLLSTPTKNAIDPKQKEKLNVAISADKKPLIRAEVRRSTLGSPTITAFDRETKAISWRKQGPSFLSMILAGDVIYAGTVDGVVALSAQDGSLLWKGAVAGRAFGLAVANGALFVSTDEGGIYCFRAGGKTTKQALARHSHEKTNQEEDAPPPVELSWGPLLQFESPTSAVVRWGTRAAVPTQLDYQTAAGPQQVFDAKQKKEHQARLENLEYKRLHRYTLSEPGGAGGNRQSSFDCDTFFNYSPAKPDTAEQKSLSDTASDRRAKQAAKKILATAETDQGLCVVFGVGPLVAELARASDLNIVCVETDAKKIAAARDALQEEGLYGTRVSILEVESLQQLPLPSHFANLVVSAPTRADADFGPSAAEAFRLLRPEEGVGLFGRLAGEQTTAEELEAYFRKDGVAAEITADESGLWAHFTKPPLAGAGEWSHQYARGDNSAFGGELLGYTSVANEMETQWVGRPGPRYQPDRNGRKPGPLATGGRLFAQGLERIVALDGYNGTILWSAEIPAMRRFNIPRDSSNWCADRDAVYLAVADRCWQFDARSGELRTQYEMPPSKGEPEDGDRVWSYIASLGPLLLGSDTVADAPYEEFRGHAAWYDQPKGPEAAKVCSDSLFALNKESGDEVWIYRDGLIINSTITSTPEKIYFVESRDKDLLAGDARRIESPDLWKNQFLVGLDADSGEKLWEQPLETDAGESVFYLAHQRGKLVIVASGSGKYHVTVYGDEDGQLDWEDRFDWPGGKHDHGKAMSRPAMINGNLFVRPRVYDLASGRTLAKVMPGGGCGTYACAGNFLIFRSGNITLWDHRYEIPSQWARLRPGCWLSAIPAGGMLLAPEAGGGCSCGNWMETSVGFMPKTAKPVVADKSK